MGISKTTAVMLLGLKEREFLKGSLLQLGVQRVSREAKTFVRMSCASEVRAVSERANSSRKEFWHSLGLTKISSLDNSDFEGAEIICDLNTPVDDIYAGKFDVVFDGGTSEHVFNASAVLMNVDKLLKVGGLAIHEVPGSNMLDHGFYSFGPTFFRDYYSVRNFEIIEICVVVKSKRRARVYLYFPRDSGEEIPESWGSNKVTIWCVARKISEINDCAVPQQTMYKNIWCTHLAGNVETFSKFETIPVLKKYSASAITILSRKFSLLEYGFGMIRALKVVPKNMLLIHKIRSKFDGI